jgi:hypothetical protein
LFIAGIGLVASSFLVYPAYPFIILYLPFAGHVKFTVIVTAWIVSWVVFGVGILLAGWEGYEIIKRPLNRRSVWKKRDALNSLNHRDEPRGDSPQ